MAKHYLPVYRLLLLLLLLLFLFLLLLLFIFSSSYSSFFFLLLLIFFVFRRGLQTTELLRGEIAPRPTPQPRSPECFCPTGGVKFAV